MATQLYIPCVYCEICQNRNGARRRKPIVCSRALPRVLLTIAVLMGAALAPSMGAAATSFLHTQGQDIVNERGDKVLLRGVGLGNWLLPEGYMWKFGNQGDRPRRIEKIVNDLIGPEKAREFWSEFRKRYITEADIKRIAELGFNSVRPALNSRLFLTETDPPVRVEEGYVLLDNLVAWCRANGVYVILDMHGAPGGQTGQNIDDSPADLPGLFMDAKYQDQLVDLWKTIALRYKDEPAVAGYDLLNEPLPERTGAARAHKAKLEPLYRRITKAIREVDSRHMIILEGADWSNDWSVFSRPFDSNLVYQFHYYCWDNPAQVKDIQTFLNHRKRLNAPVWVGETGEKDNAIYWATTEYFETHNIGWSFWPWKKMDTSNTPVSIKTPPHWEAVAAYSRGGPAPSPAVAQQAFDGLLRNIRLENCVFFPDVVNALMRRAPARIEAENFGQDGQGESYSVRHGEARSKFYRLSQPVPINAGESTRRRSDLFITLGDTEWAAYTISSGEAKEYSVIVRVKASAGPAEALLTIGQGAFALKIPQRAWTELKIGTVKLNAGANRLKWLVTSGSVDLDWLELTLPDPVSASAGEREIKLVIRFVGGARPVE